VFRVQRRRTVTTSEDLALADGARIRIRPLTPADGPELVRGVEHLSPRSRYRRFLGAGPSLDPRTVAYLTDVDHHDHEALGAADAATGEGIGVARFVRDPEHATRAEVAVAIVDDWQGRGVGALLLDRLAARARAEGIATFTGLVLADNRAMLALFARLGPIRRGAAEAGAVAVEVDL
jgi:GNAT superfamily N-acetyltransferase